MSEIKDDAETNSATNLENPTLRGLRDGIDYCSETLIVQVSSNETMAHLTMDLKLQVELGLAWERLKSREWASCLISAGGEDTKGLECDIRVLFLV